MSRRMSRRMGGRRRMSRRMGGRRRMSRRMGGRRRMSRRMMMGGSHFGQPGPVDSICLSPAGPVLPQCW